MNKYLVIILAVVFVVVGVVYFVFRPAPGVDVGGGGGGGGLLVGSDGNGGGVAGSSAIVGKVRPVAGAAPLEFSSVEVGIYDPESGNEISRVFLDADGSYSFTVPSGEYVIDLTENSAGSSGDLPQRVFVGEGEKLDINFRME